MSHPAAIRIEGLVATPVELTYADLARLPGQVADVGQLVPGRHGQAVRLREILAGAGVAPEATHLTVVSRDGDFAASVPLAALDDALVVYRLGDAPLPASAGGPARFLIPGAARCRTAEIDTCANVKFVGTLRLGAGPGADTRPATPRRHAALHRRPGHGRLA